MSADAVRIRFYEVLMHHSMGHWARALFTICALLGGVCFCACIVGLLWIVGSVASALVLWP